MVPFKHILLRRKFNDVSFCSLLCVLTFNCSWTWVSALFIPVHKSRILKQCYSRNWWQILTNSTNLNVCTDVGITPVDEIFIWGRNIAPWLSYFTDITYGNWNVNIIRYISSHCLLNRCLLFKIGKENDLNKTIDSGSEPSHVISISAELYPEFPRTSIATFPVCNHLIDFKGRSS